MSTQSIQVCQYPWVEKCDSTKQAKEPEIVGVMGLKAIPEIKCLPLPHHNKSFRSLFLLITTRWRHQHSKGPHGLSRNQRPIRDLLKAVSCPKEDVPPSPGDLWVPPFKVFAINPGEVSEPLRFLNQKTRVWIWFCHKIRG